MTCHLLLFYATTNHFSIGLWCVTKDRFYTKTRDDQLSGWMEKKLQNISWSQICPRKRPWSLHGCLLPVWSAIAFWIPVKPFHVRNVLSKSLKCTKSFNAYSWQWSTEMAQFFTTTMPNHISYKQGLKSWTNWVMNFASSTIFTCIFTNWLPLLQAFGQRFAWKNVSLNSRRQKMLSYSLLKPKHVFLCYRNEQICFLQIKMCWL